MFSMIILVEKAISFVFDIDPDGPIWIAYILVLHVCTRVYSRLRVMYVYEYSDPSTVG